MPQQQLDKQFFDLRAGLFTEAGYLNAPDGSTSDEENFRILIDGSRRRRKGLKLETGGSNYTLPATLATDAASSSGYWSNAAGDPDKDFIVLQLGGYIHIYEDTGNTLSTQKYALAISLEPYLTTGTLTDATTNPVSFASGNGYLLVCGRYIEPFYVEYDRVTDNFTITQIEILQRDFHTIDEPGVRFNTEPTTLSEAHEYNLNNRGWDQTELDAYFLAKSKYPALGMAWYKGYARQVDGTTYINEDGVKAWNSDKIEAEPFGNASAPTGSLLLNPFDTTEGYQTAPDTLDIVGDWSVASTAADPWVITINTSTAHGLTHPEEVVISGQFSRYTYVDPEPGVVATIEDVGWTFDGTYTTASVVDTDTFTIEVDRPVGWDSWDTQYESTGAVATGGALKNNVDGYTTNERPTICGWFAGRAWFGGINHPSLLDRLFFSKLLYTNDKDFGVCYQQNDPTAEQFNQLNADDGGVLVISDIGRGRGLLDYNGSLLLFTDEGVWEVSGSRGVFTADNFNVRKMSDNECTSFHGYELCEGIVMYTGNKGIFAIQPDERTGILYSQSISAAKIQEAWNDIPTAKQNRVKIKYDEANKHVWFLYSDDSADTYAYEYDSALVYDLRLQAFSKMKFPSAAASYIMEAHPIKAADASETYKKLKFFVQKDTRTTLDVCDFGHTDYTDFDGLEQVPYMILAYDNIGTWSRHRQAPKVHTFMAKTETGFDGSMNPVNESSLLMQARWDWSDNTASGKWGTEIQIYRHVRPYTPTDASDEFDDGYPVVVTRNKVRGRGRSLHLKFTGETAKDAHLLGYAIRYQVDNKI